MSELENLEAGGRHDLWIPPGAPKSHLQDEAGGTFGYVHSYETASRYDGPGLRFAVCLGMPASVFLLPQSR